MMHVIYNTRLGQRNKTKDMEMEMQEELQIVPVMAKDVEAQFVEILVPLYSYGCGRKMKKALAHFKGIYSVNVDYNQQKVTVWGICNKKEVLSTIRAKRKGARFWNHQEDNNDDVQSHTAPPSPLSIIKGRRHPFPLNWKAAWKKVFNRSYSL